MKIAAVGPTGRSSASATRSRGRADVRQRVAEIDQRSCRGNRVADPLAAAILQQNGPPSSDAVHRRSTRRRRRCQQQHRNQRSDDAIDVRRCSKADGWHGDGVDVGLMAANPDQSPRQIALCRSDPRAAACGVESLQCDAGISSQVPLRWRVRRCANATPDPFLFRGRHCSTVISVRRRWCGACRAPASSKRVTRRRLSHITRSLPPLVRIDELRLCRVLHQVAKERVPTGQPRIVPPCDDRKSDFRPVTGCARTRR
jgi:hypothetical protein